MADLCEKIQRLGKGVSSSTRYKIVEALMDGPKPVSDIVAKVKLSQPAVSQHLRTLKACGLVESAKHGQEVHYSLNIRHLLKVLSGFSSRILKCKRAPRATS